MVIIYSISSVTGFLLSSAMGFVGMGGRLTLGASAPILGLIGALVHYGRRSGSRAIGSQAWAYAISTVVFGFVKPRIDNFAHVGGFCGGQLDRRARDPLKPERAAHPARALIPPGFTC